MKRILTLIILTQFVFGCKETIDFSGAKVDEESKTLSLTIKNVPDDAQDERLFVFTIIEGEIYSTGETVAVEDTTILVLPPDGNKAYDLVAFIPTSKDWKLSDDLSDSEGYYSKIAGLTLRSTNVVIDSWENEESLDDVSGDGALLAIDVTLEIEDPSGIVLLGARSLAAAASGEKLEFEAGDIVEIDATVDNNGAVGVTISSVTYYINDSEIKSYTKAPYLLKYNTVDLAVGVYTVKVVATNSLGQTDVDEEDIIIVGEDEEGPSVEITEPDNRDELTHGLTYEIEASISSGTSDIATVEYKINGTTVASYTDEDDYSYYEWNTYDNNVGAVTIEVIATDEAGQSRSDIINVTLIAPENYTPYAAITSPSANATIEQGTVIDLKVSITDKEGDITTVYYYVDGGQVGTGDDASSFTLEDYSTAGLAAGKHTIYAEAYDDESSQVGKEVSFTITVPAP
ncbi:Ig-like domain-containing protein [Reichenbachiella agarivorans]|uniref:Ig-like domain-containing protein n=1 Tax=Reichenbachiella agarivorans TaxID=2979464 RepID=A0ABY6CU82_9BACT|nr:Ig-like domain-containing protein [Reichenbachiella agarivorans]UXP33008.1 Ig-like domain-containing protein [Reichenbachiella agarivorans]